MISTSLHAEKNLRISKEVVEPIVLTPYLHVYQNVEDLSPSAVLEIMSTETRNPELTSTSFGFSKDFFWLKISVVNLGTEVSKNIIRIKNPHLDLVKAWNVSDPKNISLIYLGGDGIQFYDRTVYNRNIVIPLRLNVNDSVTYLIQVDKRNASVSIPIKLMSEKHFEEIEKEALFGFGIYFGVLLLIMVFSLFVGYLLRQSIFLWYALYLCFLGMYLLAHIGLFFQIFHPENNWFSDYSRPVFITISVMALLHFMRLMLNLKKLLPNWSKVYTFLIGFTGFITFYWVATPWWHDEQTIVYLNFQNNTLLISLVVVLITSFLTYKKQKVLVMFFWVAFMAILFAGIFIILIELGMISENSVSINPLFIGSIIEAMVFALGLSYWSKVNDAERLQLIDMIQRSKTKIVDSYIQGVEEEKSKIAGDLHDDIGSKLAYLKRSYENEEDTDPLLLERLQNLNARIRKLSHELSPPSFENNEFLGSVHHMVKTYRTKQTQVNLQLFDIPENLTGELTRTLYRIIQSALNSIQRHAKASQVDIQFFYYKDELVLTIEDNGVGFNFNKNNPGITMKEMINRVEIVNGTIDISSSQRHGTSIMINVPV
jgi:signal transduction histidine kinase